MSEKDDKYIVARNVAEILARECGHFEDTQGVVMFRFLDFEKEEDREFLKTQIDQMIQVFKAAKYELNGGTSNGNSK